MKEIRSQSLFYWITYSYNQKRKGSCSNNGCLNPYFIGLPILILAAILTTDKEFLVSILILLDYLFLYRSVEKALYLLLLQNFFQTLKSTFF